MALVGSWLEWSRILSPPPRAFNRAKTDEFGPFFGLFMPRGGKTRD
jgi:hypothetical protein